MERGLRSCRVSWQVCNWDWRDSVCIEVTELAFLKRFARSFDY